MSDCQYNCAGFAHSLRTEQILACLVGAAYAWSLLCGNAAREGTLCCVAGRQSVGPYTHTNQIHIEHHPAASVVLTMSTIDHRPRDTYRYTRPPSFQTQTQIALAQDRIGCARKMLPTTVVYSLHSSHAPRSNHLFNCRSQSQPTMCPLSLGMLHNSLLTSHKWQSPSRLRFTQLGEVQGKQLGRRGLSAAYWREPRLLEKLS